jgi:hypothetical protein
MTQLTSLWRPTSKGRTRFARRPERSSGGAGIAGDMEVGTQDESLVGSERGSESDSCVDDAPRPHFHRAEELDALWEDLPRVIKLGEQTLAATARPPPTGDVPTQTSSPSRMRTRVHRLSWGVAILLVAILVIITIRYLFEARKVSLISSESPRVLRES